MVSIVRPYPAKVAGEGEVGWPPDGDGHFGGGKLGVGGECVEYNLGLIGTVVGWNEVVDDLAVLLEIGGSRPFQAPRFEESVREGGLVPPLGGHPFFSPSRHDELFVDEPARFGDRG